MRTVPIYVLGFVVFALLILNADRAFNFANAQVKAPHIDLIPSFLVVGKSYRCNATGRPLAVYTVLTTDKASGWFEATMQLSASDHGNMAGVLTKGRQWFNISRFDSCYLLSEQELEKMRQDIQKETERLLRDPKTTP